MGAMPEDAKNTKTTFPKDFLWGASTSAHQVEGGNHNQWTVWELANAAELAKTAKKNLGWVPVWGEIANQAQSPNNYVSGKGVEHYKRYEEDFDLVKKLNLNAFRFGVEWSRIEPQEGNWNEEAINHYKKYIAALKKRDIQPVINLWHWTMPVWFDEKGGFAKRKNIDYFVRFVQRIAEDIVLPSGWVITVNEPNSYVGMSYLDGQWPPQKHDPLLATSVMLNLATAHKRVYRLLKEIDPSLSIGVATQCNNNQPKRPDSIIDRLVASSANYFWNWWFLNRVKKYQDFVGFNYYFTDYFKGFMRRNPKEYPRHQHHTHSGHRGLSRKTRHNPLGPTSDLGWYMEPSGIYKVLMEAAKRYKQPILITETGVADMHDKYRKWWIEETLAAASKANKNGANIIGYFHWSLLDNFEWSDGWWSKFGLVSVDREHGMKRTIRPSAKWFAQKIKTLSE